MVINTDSTCDKTQLDWIIAGKFIITRSLTYKIGPTILHNHSRNRHNPQRNNNFPRTPSKKRSKDIQKAITILLRPTDNHRHRSPECRPGQNGNNGTIPLLHNMDAIPFIHSNTSINITRTSQRLQTRLGPALATTSVDVRQPSPFNRIRYLRTTSGPERFEPHITNSMRMANTIPLSSLKRCNLHCRHHRRHRRTMYSLHPGCLVSPQQKACMVEMDTGSRYPFPPRHRNRCRHSRYLAISSVWNSFRAVKRYRWARLGVRAIVVYAVVVITTHLCDWDISR